MRLTKLVGRRLKETPRDAQTISHTFLLRGGYIRQVSAGIYSLLPLAKRIIAKIERIIREEMNAVDGQEVLMPVVLPSELWEESGRYTSVGPELLRFRDRNDKPMLLGMTHEEAVVHLTRSEVNSYRQLPIMLYQIQTKYRDEARPRAGLIRVREFTMKDAYSFHASIDCLRTYYQSVHAAYERIFQRTGCRDVISIQSDPGMMGGNLSHEFMALAECGEDIIFMSPNGEYRANRDIARTAIHFIKDAPLPLEKVHTPKQKTIEEVTTFLGLPTTRSGKAVMYADEQERLIFVVIRGDLDVNEVKLANHLCAKELKPASDAHIRSTGAVPGFASPMNIRADANVRIIFDPSAVESSNLVVGANEEDYHFINFNFARDMGGSAAQVELVDIAVARAGDPCPVTGEPLVMKRGIEVGNIFQLGTKYSEAMNCVFLDENGQSHPMIMGCYGIGVGRLMATIIEQSHDEYGPIWPLAVAPFHVHLCALNIREPAVQASADALYDQLLAAGIETVYDDRGEKAGFMFNDADLMGVPYRLIISPKTVAKQEVEFRTRDKQRTEFVALGEAVTFIKNVIAATESAISAIM